MIAETSRRIFLGTLEKGRIKRKRDFSGSCLVFLLPAKQVFVLPSCINKSILIISGGEVPSLYNTSNGPASVPLSPRSSTAPSTCSTNTQGKLLHFLPVMNSPVLLPVVNYCCGFT